MKVTEREYPVLRCLVENQLTDEIKEFVFRQTSERKEQDDILSSLKFFEGRKLKISYISDSVHNMLTDSLNYVHLKHLLKNSPETTGLLLLPRVLLPDFTNVPDYVKIDNRDFPLNAIMYSWISLNAHDRINENYDEEEPWDEEERMLLILPIFGDGTTQATRQFEMTNNDDLYRWEYSESEGRAWYGNVLDYVMSFILFYNYEENKKLTTQDVRKRKFEINEEGRIDSHINKGEIIE